MNMFVPEKLDVFDLVVAFSVLSVVPTKGNVLNACRTLTMNLKQGGRFVMVGLNPQQAPEAHPLSEKYGFKVLNSTLVKEEDSLRCKI